MRITVNNGDDVRIITTLTEDGGAGKDVSAAGNISAALTSRDGKTTYCSNLALAIGDPDAAWATGVVVVTFAAADTGTLPTGGGIRLEVQVTLSTLKTTWFSDAIDSKNGVLT